MTLPIASLAALTCPAVVSAARTTMSSNFSRPSLVTAMSAPVLFWLFALAAPSQNLMPANYANPAPAQWREPRLILLLPLSLRYFRLRAIPESTHHVRASAEPDSATVGLGQWPN